MPAARRNAAYQKHVNRISGARARANAIATSRQRANAAAAKVARIRNHVRANAVAAMAAKSWHQGSSLRQQALNRLATRAGNKSYVARFQDFLFGPEAPRVRAGYKAATSRAAAQLPASHNLYDGHYRRKAQLALKR